METYTPVEIESLISGFCEKTLPKESWTHEAHILVAIWHNWHFDAEEALQKVKKGIISYNVSVGTENTDTSGYHETMTRFWMRITRLFVESHKFGSIDQAVNAMLNSPYSAKTLPFDYYDRKTLFSVHARHNWVEPDQKAIRMNTIINETKGEFCISTDKQKLDLKAVHKFLSEEAYWSKNVPFEIVRTAAEHSLTFGLYRDEQQIGYARVITDHATFAYLADVYVLAKFRGRGLSKWMMEIIINHPNLQKLRRWVLLTADAHGLYKQYGWTPIAGPERWMERHNKDVYK